VRPYLCTRQLGALNPQSVPGPGRASSWGPGEAPLRGALQGFVLGLPPAPELLLEKRVALQGFLELRLQDGHDALRPRSWRRRHGCPERPWPPPEQAQTQCNGSHRVSLLIMNKVSNPMLVGAFLSASPSRGCNPFRGEALPWVQAFRG